LVALSEAAGGAILPPNFVHNAVIPPSAEVAVMACGSETEDETNAPHFNEGLILNYTSRRRRVTRAVLKGSRMMNGASAPRQRSDERSEEGNSIKVRLRGHSDTAVVRHRDSSLSAR